MKERGVAYFEDFFDENPRIESYLLRNDKTPLYDGDLYLYRNETIKNENILGKIPVQVKGEKKRKNSKPNYKFTKADLEIYKNNGGVLFVKIIYENKNCYEVFASNLLPVNIEKILAENNSSAIVVELDHIKTHQELELYCKYHIDHRKFQGDPNSFLRDFPIGSTPHQIKIHTISKGNPLASFFSNNCYVYLEQPNGSKIPVLSNLFEVSTSFDAKIRIENQYYFQHIQKSTTAKNDFFLILNPILKISFSKDKIHFHLEKEKIASFEDIIDTFDFIYKATKVGEFYINDFKFTLNVETERNFIEEEYNSIQIIKNVVQHFQIRNIQSSISQLGSQFTTIEKLYELIFNKDGSYLPDAPEYFLQEFQILGSEILLFGYKIKEDKHKIINLFSKFPDELDLFKYKIETVEIRCSRFLNLAENHVHLFENHFDLVKRDLVEKYSFIMHSGYVELILKLISQFDKTKNKEFLTLAFSILRLAKKKDLFDEERIIKVVNLLQIKRRKRKLTHFEIELLLSLKTKSTNQSLICGILILLESIPEFELNYAKLNPEEQMTFKAWPIYTLRGNPN
ncbi:hypothetical protein ND856_05095 [Leptospira bandrabouensis]|uniref:hypothetical protein n=1 Tax=Leptospira bandrabouensis TaxID=2484903 RepID=UPI00223CCAFB|nr:hypothetical protein [Leptospira bandrabouensis]MCW7458752.1 hypothetical protein [Leptospira bandrabouensis]MCW7476653.1 hypothetical protein [Leptospira bandrabouensis]MCW7484335.1 hypothetical protein [Leptospira bandrabouensis]